MGKPTKVLMVYLASLLLCSILLSWLNLIVFYIPFNGGKIEVKTIMVLTVAGGIIALRFTVSIRALRIFLIIYTCLWTVRYFLIYAALHVKEISIFGRVFHMDLIIPGYYNTVSRLGTPLPFVIFWFINHLFPVSKGVQEDLNRK